MIPRTFLGVIEKKIKPLNTAKYKSKKIWLTEEESNIAAGCRLIEKFNLIRIGERYVKDKNNKLSKMIAYRKRFPNER